MEQATIAALLEKYWQAETTIEEEKMLGEYFRQPGIAPEWEPLRNIFTYFGLEAELVPSAGLETKILERIREMAGIQPPQEPFQDSAGQQGSRPVLSHPAPIRTMRRYNWSYAAAAAVILGVSLFLVIGQPRRGNAPAATAPGAMAYSGLPAAPDNIKDTYNDPQQALAAVQKALMTVSTRMNRGKKITEQQMNRLSNSWQTAVTN